ncbi:MAG: peroxiredoxin [Amaricoccus sp.]
MSIKVGDRLPVAEFLEKGPEGVAPVPSDALFSGRKVVLFAVPGAFTGICSTQHVPSFIRTREAILAKGVDEIVCVAVNDPFVMAAWSEATGARAAGIRMLADADARFTKALGLASTFPQHGMIDRSARYAMLVEDGVVTIFNPEVARGVCELSAGETLLGML